MKQEYYTYFIMMKQFIKTCNVHVIHILYFSMWGLRGISTDLFYLRNEKKTRTSVQRNASGMLDL
jgi:hypothetical protein